MHTARIRSESSSHRRHGTRRRLPAAVAALALLTAAAVALTPPAHADAAPSATSRISGPWVTNNGRGASIFEAVGVPTAGAPVAGTPGKTLAAVIDRAATWSFPAVGTTGPVMYGTGSLALCLTGASGTVHAEPCVDGKADQQYSW